MIVALLFYYRGLAEVGRKFEKDLGIPVKVETPDGLTDKFQASAQAGKGPDVIFWAHDRLGEWADAGLLKPLEIKADFKANFIPMTWDAVTHNKQIWGYPIALEAVSLIYNKKLVTTSPPASINFLEWVTSAARQKRPTEIGRVVAVRSTFRHDAGIDKLDNPLSVRRQRLTEEWA